MMFLYLFFVILATLSYYIYITVKEKYKYFEKLGIPYNEPIFLLGNAWKSLAGLENIETCLSRTYRENPGKPLVGLFHGVLPLITIRDPELVTSVLTKDFSSFHDRSIEYDDEVNPLEGHLFNIEGNKWRILRNKLSPTFTSGKIKGMLILMEKCVDAFLKELDNDLDRDIDFKQEFMKLAADIIGSCTFGIETDSSRNENSDFIRLGKKIIQPDLKEFILVTIRFFFPRLARALKFRTIPKEVDDFFLGLVKETMDYRKKTGYKRNDFLQLLLELREKGEVVFESEPNDNEDDHLKVDSQEKLSLTDNVLTAQAAVFLAAGFETTSTSLAFICYELSRNVNIQVKLREEVRSIKSKYGCFSYEALKNMPYLEAVINEVLRVWPPVGGLLRECTKTTKLGDYTIEKGILIHISTQALQRDPQYFPDPDVFRPERFIEIDPHKNTFLPFGTGPRACIGERFARLELRITVAKLVDKYNIKPCAKMAENEPITFKVGAFINVPNNGIYCSLSKLDD